jgi:hypothetical protein
MTAAHSLLPPYPTPGELARASWFKATASNGGSGCVEVAHLDRWKVVRDSKNPRGPVLCCTPDEWASFLDRARSGEFDRPLIQAAVRARQLRAWLSRSLADRAVCRRLPPSAPPGPSRPAARCGYTRLPDRPAGDGPARRR